METIYEHVGGDKLLVMGRKSNFLCPLADYTDFDKVTIAVCMSSTFGGSGNTNVASITESIPITWAIDRLFIGLKNGTVDIPAQVNNLFVGLTNASAATESNLEIGSRVDVYTNAAQEISFATVNDTTYDEETFSDTIKMPEENLVVTANRFVIFLIQMVISDRGLSTQSCTLAYQQLQNQTNSSINFLKAKVRQFNATSTTSPLSLNDGLSAYTLPDHFFLHWPLVKNKVRLHSVLVGGQKV